MGRDIRIDTKSLEAFRDQIQEMEQQAVNEFFESLAKEIAARLLRKVIKRTPTKTGNLRNLWGAAKDIKVKKTGNNYEVNIENSASYASYVEYGHRQTPGRYVPEIGKRLVNDWVDGKFMLTLSEHELKGQLPGIIKRKMDAWLAGLGGS
ncbi:Uncharacterised protein [Sebaldella termitidis]|uniref:Phage protein, HK97 gp10 family n=1 Tax=Sebaldella termitidis (strain ATCC 33386 / NCTC 11300) TaxID=526218 RepID=D1AHR2_SEBTE|nr:HK97 gp10 family phage protein [Sebaldella termitidis]ACZ08296.1 hypothetical protein Sterm_1434 [Sebaldella termitidis ATCC 33386]SUI23606.1 Uncharacterised protein [Sebaldella termitidis]